MARRTHAARSQASLAWRILVGSAAILLVALAAAGSISAPAYGGGVQAETAAKGSLHGRVRIGPRLVGRRFRFSLYPEVGQAAASPGTRSLSDELANVVIYLESAPGLASAPDSHAGPFRMEQSNETFAPHILPVAAGTVVEFPNGDPLYHNVFSLSKASSFDLGRYPRGSARSVRFDQPGIVKVFCHIHSDMSAVILVLDNPFFTAPDPNGGFRISDIPPGRYIVTGWHERARSIHSEVTIERGQQTEVDLAIPLEDAIDGR